MTEINGKVLPACMVGTWAWGSGMNGSKMIFGKRYDLEQLRNTFETAYNLGFTMWDTAEVYGMGRAEEILGDFVGGRESVIISTKHMPSGKYHKGALKESVVKSLERMKLKEIDLYWLHEPFNYIENVDEMIECGESGLIKHIGVSNFAIDDLKRVHEYIVSKGYKLTAIQNHYSLLSIERQEEILKYCIDNDIIFYGYMILEQGALSGHHDAKHPFKKISMRGLAFPKKKFRKIEALIDYIRELGRKYEIDSSQIPIAWAIKKGVTPIIGLTSPSQAVALSDGVSVELTDEEMKKLEKLALASGVKAKGVWEKN